MPGCQECALLRQKHADAALAHADLRVQLWRAVQNGSGEVVSALTISEAAALKERDVAGTALRSHEAMAHGEGDAQAQTV